MAMPRGDPQFPRSILRYSLSPYCFPEASAAVDKYAMQHLSFDRLLQDRHLSKPAIDAFGTISGHEYKRHAPRHHRIGDGVNHFSIKIDVENGRLKVLAPDCRHRIRHATER